MVFCQILCCFIAKLVHFVIYAVLSLFLLLHGEKLSQICACGVRITNIRYDKVIPYIRILHENGCHLMPT